MALYIRNKGEIERGALALLGASTKSGDQIGKFGSGFKYALATLLREGVAFRIFSGKTQILIETETERFRDKAFQVLVIDGARTSITTSTGPEWSVRDAIREIWSNAVDEGGAEKFEGQTGELLPGTTLIEIDTSHRSVKSILTSWNLHFVHDVTPLAKNCYGRILEQKTTNYFRRGVWICEDRELPGLFSYDFHDIQLPESRKIKSNSTSYEVSDILSYCTEPAVFEKMFKNLSLSFVEWYAIQAYGVHGQGRETFKEVFHHHWDFYGLEKNRDKVAKLAGTKRVLWVDDQFGFILHRNELKAIEAEVSFDDAYEILDWPIGYEERLEPVLNDLAAVGVDLRKFSIVYANVKDADKIIALADMKRKRCVLTSGAFDATTTMLAKALVEEWTHLEHGVLDNTHAQQHVYLNLIIDLIKRIK